MPLPVIIFIKSPVNFCSFNKTFFSCNVILYLTVFNNYNKNFMLCSFKILFSYYVEAYQNCHVIENKNILFMIFKMDDHLSVRIENVINNYIILDGLEGDTRIYCQRC